jgi:hypothetical protein
LRGALDPFDGGEPGGGAGVAVESGVNAVAFDRGDMPSVAGAERGSQVFLTDGMRAGIGAFVAEAQHVQGSTALGDGRETRSVRRALLGVEGVEEAGVEHGLKFAAQTLEMERVGRDEFSLQPAVMGFLSGNGQRGFRYVKAEDGQSQRSDEERIFAGAASSVEHRSGESAFGSEARDCGLRTANIPGRRLSAKVGSIPRLPGHAFVTGWTAASERILARIVSGGS